MGFCLHEGNALSNLVPLKALSFITIKLKKKFLRFMVLFTVPYAHTVLSIALMQNLPLREGRTQRRIYINKLENSNFFLLGTAGGKKWIMTHGHLWSSFGLFDYLFV